MELRILPGNIANMIAAGEVVQRPSSVVKELMENSLDAGATQVSVTIQDAGRTLVQVIDNGSGMSPDDAVLCFERHATSKIATAEDLENILTFGFRGEALASIAAVAEVTLRTRREEDELGCEVVFAASEHLSTKEVQAPKGSSFSVRNLFYNVPARRKFLKSDNVEFKHIYEEFTRVVLTRPDVGFTLIHNGKEVSVLRPAKSLKFRIMDLLGQGVVGDVVDISADTTIAKVSGFIGRPEGAKKTLGNQFFFVNGRYFRSPYLHKAVMKAYEGMIPEGTTPSYFIYIETDPSAIDVNIHPTKTEIKFEEDSVVFQIIFAAVKESLGYNAISGDIDFENPEASKMPVLGTNFGEYRPSSIPSAGLDPDYNPFNPEPFQGRFDLPSAEPVETPDYSKYVSKNENYGKLFEDRTLPTSQVMTVHGKYILSQSKSGIMVINVRRAKERIFFDRFLRAFRKSGHITQTALFPQQVSVGVAQRQIFDENADLLSSLGFDITPFGNDSVVVNGVPEGYSTEQGKVETMLSDILLILSDNTTTLQGVMENSMAEKFAILGASGSSEVSSPIEAQRLIDSLLSSDNPEFTSSGKKIIAIIPIEELEKKF